MRVVTSVSPTTTYGLHLCQPDFAHRTMSTMPARGNEWCVQYTPGVDGGGGGGWGEGFSQKFWIGLCYSGS